MNLEEVDPLPKSWGAVAEAAVVSGTLANARSRAHVRDRLERVFEHYPHRVARIVVRGRDENGPKGGIDQICRISIVLPAFDDVIVEKRGVTPQLAFDAAFASARRVLRRLQDRRPLRTRRAPGSPARPAEVAKPAATGVRRANAEEGSLIGRRVGRTAAKLRKVAERPEKKRKDVWVDTAQPGTSASDRRVGAGSTARRNTKLATRGMASALEDSAKDRPSRKSTRKSKNRQLQDGNLRLRATGRAVRSRKPSSPKR